MTQTQARTSVVTLRELLEAGVHFGHQTRRWNPKMKKFIFGERNGIYIIDVRATLKGIEKSYVFVRDLVADGGTIMFVSTKKQMTDIVKDAADRCDMPYVNYRWLGGMLTNFQTIHGRIEYLRELEAMEDDGRMESLPKKEALRLRREREKLERYLGGMKNLDAVPDAVFVVDTKKEHIGVTEARKKGVTVVALLDTNCDPDEVDFGIPANDDAIRSGVLMARVIADAVEEGKLMKARLGGSGKNTRRHDPDADIKRRQERADAAAYLEERAKQEAEELRRAERLAKEAEKEAEAAASAPEAAAEAAPAAEAETTGEE